MKLEFWRKTWTKLGWGRGFKNRIQLNKNRNKWVGTGVWAHLKTQGRHATHCFQWLTEREKESKESRLKYFHTIDFCRMFWISPNISTMFFLLIAYSPSLFLLFPSVLWTASASFWVVSIVVYFCLRALPLRYGTWQSQESPQGMGNEISSKRISEIEVRFTATVGQMKQGWHRTWK
jgi:hypothetical protein